VPDHIPQPPIGVAVASGCNSISVGTVSGYSGIANTASNNYASAFVISNTASGQSATAVGIEIVHCAVTPLRLVLTTPFLLLPPQPRIQKHRIRRLLFSARCMQHIVGRYSAAVGFCNLSCSNGAAFGLEIVPVQIILGVRSK